MEGLGCEVKLLRLRERYNDIKNVNKGFVKAVIFIEIKMLMILWSWYIIQ